MTLLDYLSCYLMFVGFISIILSCFIYMEYRDKVPHKLSKSGYIYFMLSLVMIGLEDLPSPIRLFGVILFGVILAWPTYIFNYLILSFTDDKSKPV